MLNTDALLDQHIFHWLQDNKNKERILISDLIEFSVGNETLLLQINAIKKALISNVLGKYTYNRVMKRKLFYDDYVASIAQQNMPIGLVASTINDRMPPESCTERTIRNLIKKTPPPYYTDYPPSVGLSVESQKALLEQAITSIRGMFGMNTRMLSSRSQRLSKSSFPKIRPSLFCNSQKSEHNVNTTITINNSFVQKIANTPSHYSMNSKLGGNNNNNNNLFFGEKSKSSKVAVMSPPSLNGDVNQLRKSKTENSKGSINNVLNSDNITSKMSPDLYKNNSNGAGGGVGSNNNDNRISNSKDRFSFASKYVSNYNNNINNTSPNIMTASASKKNTSSYQPLHSPKSPVNIMEKQSRQSEQSHQFQPQSLQQQQQQQQQQRLSHSKTVVPQSIVFPPDSSFSNNLMSPHNFGGGINANFSPTKNPQSSSSLLKGSKLTTIASVPGQTDDSL